MKYSILTYDSYFFYPETSHRSLEQIDLIFAKGYIEKMSYVKASHELPKLSVEDMERMALQYGLVDTDDLKKHGVNVEKGSSTEHVEAHRVSGVNAV